MKTKVLVVVFDGCRPDALAQAHTPQLDALWQTGAYTWSAQSVMPSITLPAHMSMWRGVKPETHGTHTNVFNTATAAYPSAFEVAHRANRSTALFYSWEQLRDLSSPGHLMMSYCRAAQASDDGTDEMVVSAAAAYLIAEQPDLAFVYCGDTDLIGHDFGWMSDPYIATIERLDQALGGLLNALARAQVREHYTLLFLSDHGGHDHDHGTDAMEDMTIPWFLNGPQIRRGYALQQPVNLIDTAATIAYLLDVPRPAVWDGQPVLEAFVD
ncbi:MAG: alkaline phosphatase family protein [Anaerolineae bacterium]|nr:alkaline phosphatase family protein [Anaerolineae bacterium]